MQHKLQWTDHAEVFPGEHTVKIVVITNYFGMATYRASKTVRFYAHAGHTYKAHGKIRSGVTWVWVVDEGTNKIVVGEEYSVASQATSDAREEVSSQPVQRRQPGQDHSGLSDDDYFERQGYSVQPPTGKTWIRIPGLGKTVYGWGGRGSHEDETYASLVRLSTLIHYESMQQFAEYVSDHHKTNTKGPPGFPDKR